MHELIEHTNDLLQCSEWDFRTLANFAKDSLTEHKRNKHDTLLPVEFSYCDKCKYINIKDKQTNKQTITFIDN